MRVFSYYNERTIGVFGRLSSGSLDLRGSLLMRVFFMENDLCFRDCYELRISRSDNGSAQYHDQKKIYKLQNVLLDGFSETKVCQQPESGLVNELIRDQSSWI
jgi:hypothetical protein